MKRPPDPLRHAAANSRRPSGFSRETLLVSWSVHPRIRRSAARSSITTSVFPAHASRPCGRSRLHPPTLQAPADRDPRTSFKETSLLPGSTATEPEGRSSRPLQHQAYLTNLLRRWDESAFPTAPPRPMQSPAAMLRRKAAVGTGSDRSVRLFRGCALPPPAKPGNMLRQTG
jgi:hypothetical protein